MAERTNSHNEFIEIVQTIIDNNIFKEDEKKWDDLSKRLLGLLKGDINPGTLSDIMVISKDMSLYLKDHPGTTEEDKVNRHELSKIMWKAYSELQTSANKHAAATAHKDKRRRTLNNNSQSTPPPSNNVFSFNASGKSIEDFTNIAGGKKKNRTKRHRKKDIKMRRKSKSNTKSKRKNKTRTKRS